jgi:hypothetical protein
MTGVPLNHLSTLSYSVDDYSKQHLTNALGFSAHYAQ